jgi:hypothetical protein
MRLRLFDRLRRMVRFRSSATYETGTAQGRHRRVRGGFPEPPSLGPAGWPEATGSHDTRANLTPTAFGPGPDSQSGPGPASYGGPGPSGQRGPGLGSPFGPGPDGQLGPERGGHRQPGPGPSRQPGPPPARQPGQRTGAGRARIRENPQDLAAQSALHHDASPGPQAAMHQEATAGLQSAAAERAWGQPAHASLASAPAADLAAVAAGIPRQSAGPGASARRAAGGRELPLTYPEAPEARQDPAALDALGRPSQRADGRRNCGSLEKILWRQWDPASPPPREVVTAVDRLAELPERIKERLAAGLDAIFIGPGGVPELDDMTSLRGVLLPAGRATWDACAGAYGERKIVVGSQPSPTPDVMCHEVGHALDDLDSSPGEWQSDSAEFRALYEQCRPHLASDFHHQPGGLGRKEFFADAFAAIASRQRPALVDMLGGNTRTALHVMLYFNRRYGI